MTKKERLARILQLIENYEISTQEELTAKLNESGLHVSQATVSRDINELNLLKAKGVTKKIKYVKFSPKNKEIPDKIVNLYRQIVLSVECANNLIVIKTLAGNAGSAGVAIDAMHFPEIMGTIAGDDTLLVVAKNNEDAELIVKSLRMI